MVISKELSIGSSWGSICLVCWVVRERRHELKGAGNSGASLQTPVGAVIYKGEQSLGAQKRITLNHLTLFFLVVHICLVVCRGRCYIVGKPYAAHKMLPISHDQV